MPQNKIEMYVGSEMLECKKMTSERERFYKKHPVTKRATAVRVNSIHTTIKSELVKYKGGCCHNCNAEANAENQCMFTFHHINPQEKDRVIADIQNLDAAKKEADKCILLCMNCHALEHYKLDQMRKHNLLVMDRARQFMAFDNCLLESA